MADSDRIFDVLKRWALLDFRPKKEDEGCPQCGSKLRSFTEQQCYKMPHRWHWGSEYMKSR